MAVRGEVKTPSRPGAGRGGPDSPADLSASDPLGRRSFAREILDLATSFPSEEQVTVGVYGTWGSGKTSVLNYVGRLATEENHLVATFNPWGITDSASLWAEFRQAVNSASGASRIARVVARLLPSAAGAFKEVSEILPKSVAVAGTVGLRTWLRRSRPQVDRLADELIRQNKRILILVDDLDRTDESLLPELLFAVRELFDLRGFSFVLALDPNRVERALGHKINDNQYGALFLEKIVHFPRWLPLPSDSQMLAMLRTDCHRYGLERAEAGLPAILQYISGSPRHARQFVRNLVSLRREIARYRDDEIKWPILLLTSLLKTRWASASHVLFSSTKHLEDVVSASAVKSLGKVDPLSRIAEQLVIPKEERSAFVEILERLAGQSFASVETIRNHAQMVENPELITWKDYDACVLAWRASSASGLIGWIDHHAAARSIARVDVHRELFLTAIKRLATINREAALHVHLEQVGSAVAASLECLDLIEALAYAPGLGLLAAPTGLHAEDIGALVSTAAAWLQFKDPPHSAARTRERTLLLRMCEFNSLDQTKLWSTLNEDVFDDDHPLGANPLARDATRALLAVLRHPCRKRLPGEFAGFFERPDAISALLVPSNGYSVRRLLLDVSGPLWTSEFRQAFLAACKKGGAVVAGNCLSYFDWLLNQPPNLAGFFSDKELVRSGIGAIRSTTYAPRFEGWVAGIVEKVEARSDANAQGSAEP